MLSKDEHWSISVPNEYSGPCYTYTPPLSSDPGKTVNLYMIFNMSTWDPDLQIFLHDPNTFFYSEKAEVNTKLLDTQSLKDSAYPRAVGNNDITIDITCFIGIVRNCIWKNQIAINA